ncbi:MAG: NlpC/P60 family protein [Proteobacteria bacterium]|nr:NlpC/P60 family protein [Pseudomonadota bacterium]
MEKYLVVIDPVANIRHEPIEAAEAADDYTHDDLRETQVLYNEALLCRDEIEDWYYVEAIEQKKLTRNCVWQGYPGWIRKASVTLTDKPVRHDITVKNSYALIRKDLSIESVVLLVPSVGTRFAVKESTHDEYYQVLLASGQTGWIDRSDVTRSDTMPAEAILRKSIVATAKLFLGVPYLWGGRSMSIAESGERRAESGEQKTEDRGQGSANRRQKTEDRRQKSEYRGQVVAGFPACPSVLADRSLRMSNSKFKIQNSKLITGVDCSGLINLVFRVNNIDIPRDAHDQWVVAKKITHNQLKPADLLFVSTKGRKDQITHVMLYIGRKRFIEASETGSVVQITTFKEKFGMDLTKLSNQDFGIDKKQIYFRRVVPI